MTDPRESFDRPTSQARKSGQIPGEHGLEAVPADTRSPFVVPLLIVAAFVAAVAMTILISNSDEPIARPTAEAPAAQPPAAYRAPSDKQRVGNHNLVAADQERKVTMRGFIIGALVVAVGVLGYLYWDATENTVLKAPGVEIKKNQNAESSGNRAWAQALVSVRPALAGRGMDGAWIMGSATDKVKGIANQAGGKLKEGVGKAIGNEQMQVEGLAQQAKGKVQRKVGEAKGVVKDAANKVAEKVNEKL